MFQICNPPEKAMAAHSSTLAWKIPWMEESGRLQSMGSLRVQRDWATSLWLFTFIHWRRKWQPTPVFLPGESQGRGSLVGCRPKVRLQVCFGTWSKLGAQKMTESSLLVWQGSGPNWYSWHHHPEIKLSESRIICQILLCWQALFLFSQLSFAFKS